MFPGFIFYAALAIVAIIVGLWIFFTRITILRSTLPLAIAPIFFALALMLGWKLLRVSAMEYVNDKYLSLTDKIFTRLRIIFEGIFFIYLSWIFMRLFNHLTMTIVFPWADAGLARADHWLHFDWNAYFNFIATRPFLVWLFCLCYGALTPLSVMVFIVLVLLNRIRAAEFFIAAFFSSSMLCMLIGMFFPAKAAVAYLLNDHSLVSRFPSVPGVFHIPSMQMLRNNKTPIVLNLFQLPGLVSFPSFHTDAAIIMGWSFRDTIFFWPAIMYTVLLIATTPVIGGHYMIDLIGGAVIAFAVMVSLAHLPRYRNAFSKQDSQKLDPGHAVRNQ